MKYKLYEAPIKDTALNAVEVAEKCLEKIENQAEQLKSHEDWERFWSKKNVTDGLRLQLAAKDKELEILEEKNDGLHTDFINCEREIERLTELVFAYESVQSPVNSRKP